MKSFVRFICALMLAAVLPASAFAAPNAYNFGWTTSGADMVKPFQVFAVDREKPGAYDRDVTSGHQVVAGPHRARHPH